MRTCIVALTGWRCRDKKEKDAAAAALLELGPQVWDNESQTLISGVTEGEVSKRFRHLSKECHPDSKNMKGKSPKEVHEQTELLKDYNNAKIHMLWMRQGHVHKRSEFCALFPVPTVCAHLLFSARRFVHTFTFCARLY